MTSTQIRSLIELLEAARQRPGMYLGVPEPARAESFLAGLQIGCSLLLDGPSRPHETKWNVIHERGWKWPTRGLVAYLSERGLSDAEITVELFAIELECWKRILAAQETDESAG